MCTIARQYKVLSTLTRSNQTINTYKVATGPENERIGVVCDNDVLLQINTTTTICVDCQPLVLIGSTAFSHRNVTD